MAILIQTYLVGLALLYRQHHNNVSGVMDMNSYFDVQSPPVRNQTAYSRKFSYASLIFSLFPH